MYNSWLSDVFRQGVKWGEQQLIAKIKAQGPVAFRIDEVHFVDIERTARNAAEIYGWTPLYRLPEGD